MYLDPSRKWRTAEWVRTQLLQCEELQAYVGDKIYPVIVSEGTPGDYIAVYRSAYGRERDKTGDTSSRAYVTVLCFAYRYDRSLELAELVDGVLDGGRNDEIGRIFPADTTATLDSSEEAFSDGMFLQSLTFEIS